jgi:hypothetical protein
MSDKEYQEVLIAMATDDNKFETLLKKMSDNDQRYISKNFKIMLRNCV